MLPPERRITINISGLIFETKSSTLGRFPHTLLGNVSLRDKYYDPKRNEYFFERHRNSFEAILFFYQSNGTLSCPDDVPVEVFLEEIEFFQLGTENIKKFRRKHGLLEEIEVPIPQNKFKQTIWKILECPDSSLLARCVATFSLFMIAFSIIIIIIETMPCFRKQEYPTHSSIARRTSNVRKFLSHMENICVVWFTFEYCARLFVTEKKKQFICRLGNIIDILAIVPYFVQFTTKLLWRYQGSRSKVSSYAIVLRSVRLIGIFRVFKISKYFQGLQMLLFVLSTSWKELLMLVLLLFVGVLVFSSFIYFVEDNNSQFSSIPSSFWWSLITITTVGYGDALPTTISGKIVGVMCAFTGVLTVTLQVPFVVSNISAFYKNKPREYRRKIDKMECLKAGS